MRFGGTRCRNLRRNQRNNFNKKRMARDRMTQQLPFIAGSQPLLLAALHEKNTMLHAPTYPPREVPCNSPAVMKKENHGGAKQNIKTNGPYAKASLHRRFQPLCVKKRYVSRSGILPKSHGTFPQSVHNYPDYTRPRYTRLDHNTPD